MTATVSGRHGNSNLVQRLQESVAALPGRCCGLASVVLGVAVVVLSFAPSVSQASPWPPAYEAVRGDYRSSYVDVKDRHGRVIERLRMDFHSRRGNWLALDELSPALVHAVISSEDQRFFEHEGVDWQAVAGAAWHSVAGRGLRGASTLSMQLAGFLDA